MTHVINRLQLEISCTDVQNAFDVRNSLTNAQQTEIIAAIDDCCSKFANTEEWLVIDKLEINLGAFSEMGFYRDFKNIFKKRFEEALYKKILERPPHSTGQGREESVEQIILKFLSTGQVPWWATESNINVDLLCRELLDNNPEKFELFLYQNLHNYRIWRRISYQIAPALQLRILALLPPLKDTLDRFIEFIITSYPSMQLSGASVISHLKEEIAPFLTNRAPFIFQSNNDPVILKKLFEQIEFTEKNVTLIVHQIASDADQAFHDRSDITEEVITSEGILDMKNTLYEEGKLAVRHAGIILLAPFLKPLFKNLGWYEEGIWNSKEDQFKAIHLTRYLSTGETGMPEYVMTLEKILCGMDIREPLPGTVDFTDDEMAEAMDVLNSVIKHWTVLKKTSIKGLRETFLKRDGMIELSDAGWRLQVERKALDVLIDSIPWGISQIRLPWNDYLIFVEW